jgi:peptide/nickel transport system substrate-binding protein
LLFSACLTACSERPAGEASSQDITVAFPEDPVVGGNFGLAEYTSLLSYEGLTNNGPDGRAVPRLAESWHWEDNDLTLRVALRPDVILHDGRAFEGEIAGEIVRRTITSRRNRANYAALADVTRLVVAGKHELVFELARPSALLPEDLTVSLDVGTGPYRVTSKTEAETVLERFDRYYLGVPTIRRVTFRSFQTLRTAWTSLLRGQVDLVYDVPGDAIEFIRNDSVRVVPLERWYQYAIAFNSKRGPLRSPAVRRALNLAMDRDALIQRVLRGAGRPSDGPVWPRYWAHDASITAFPYDPAQATALLDAAGYPFRPTPAGQDQPPARLRFECLLPDNFTVYERIALEVQKSLFNIGVDLQFKTVSLTEFNTRIESGDFDAAFFDIISGPSPGRSYIFWGSARSAKGAYNVFGYENSEVEETYRVLRTNTNEAATRSATVRLQRLFAQDPPALFLAWSQRARGIRREFAIPAMNGKDPVLSLWRWTRTGQPEPASTE